MTSKIRTTDAKAIAEATVEGYDFKTHGSLRGEARVASVVGKYHPALGRLPREAEGTIIDSDYVIYSYATPIAWRTQGQWHMPAVKYSMTTSKQQGTVRRALAYLDVTPV